MSNTSLSWTAPKCLWSDPPKITTIVVRWNPNLSRPGGRYQEGWYVVPSSSYNRLVRLAHATTDRDRFTKNLSHPSMEQDEESCLHSLMEKQDCTTRTIASTTTKTTTTAAAVATTTTTKRKASNGNSTTYQTNLVLAALARECQQQRTMTQAVRAYEMLQTMEVPDTVAYNSVLKAFAKLSPSRGRVWRDQSATMLAETLFQEMKDVYNHQRTKNSQWYDAMTKGTLTDEEVSRGPPLVTVRPNIRTYGTLMDAYAREGTREAAEAVERLLRELENAFQERGDDSLQPSLIIYNTVLAAWSRVPGGVTRCVEWLRVMPLSPDVISYNSVLHAMARSGWPDAGDQSEAILRGMSTRSVKPNARSYTTCIHAWSQCGQPEKALALLQEMHDLYQSTNDNTVRPNDVSYSTVIHAYAVSRVPHKATKAHEVFQQMIRAGVKPSRVTYNNLLNCYASAGNQPNLMSLVQDLYQQMLASDEQPDQCTFGTVLKACSNLCWNDGWALMVFQEACHRGLVSRGVLQQFRRAVSIQDYRSIVGRDDAGYEDIPGHWTHAALQKGTIPVHDRS